MYFTFQSINCTSFPVSDMTSVKLSLASVATARSSHGHFNVPKSAFLPGFDGSRSLNKGMCYNFSVRPKATLSFDNSVTKTTNVKPKHTIDPAAPDFLPLPSFEECFPKSTKESR